MGLLEIAVVVSGVAVVLVLLLAGPVALARRGAMYCLICAQPNRRVHSCHIHAKARVQSHYKKRYGRMGMLSKARWCGVVYDRFGDLWHCDHGHDQRTAARGCAQSRVRHLQTHPEAIPPIHAGRPKTTTKPARLPITDLPGREWSKLKQRYNQCCAYCGASGVPLEREHVIPLSRGGANTANNIVPSCGPCNRSKGTLTGDEFVAMRTNRAERLRVRRSDRNVQPNRYHRPPTPTVTLVRGRTLRPGETTWAVRRFETIIERISDPPVSLSEPPGSAKPKKPTLPPGLKRCTVCKLILPLDNFGSNRSRGDGLNNRCRNCARYESRRQNERRKQAKAVEQLADAAQDLPSLAHEPDGVVWRPDPMGRHEWRVWDGRGWTQHVVSGGVLSIDPVDVRK